MAKNVGETVRLTPITVVKSLMREAHEAKTKVGKINGTIGQSQKEAEDKKGLHIKAFKDAQKLDRMDGSTLRSYLTHFDHYRAGLKLDERAAEQGDFIADEEEKTSAKKKTKAGGKGGNGKTAKNAVAAKPKRPSRAKKKPAQTDIEEFANAPSVALEHADAVGSA